MGKTRLPRSPAILKAAKACPPKLFRWTKRGGNFSPVLSRWVFAFLVLGNSAAYCGPWFRIFSQPSRTLSVQINGVSGELVLAHFKCPTVLHAATCGLSYFAGEPFLMNLLAHTGLVVSERFHWVEFYPQDPEEQPRITRLLRTTDFKTELHRLVEAQLKTGQVAVMQRFGREADFYGGALRIQVHTQRLKRYAYTPTDHPSGVVRGRPEWVPALHIDFPESELVYELRGTGQFFRIAKQEGKPPVEEEIAPSCADFINPGW